MQNIIQTFTRQPTPPRQPSRAERRQQQRDRERLQRQQEAQLQELEQQQRELQAALRAAAGSSHLTRHQTKLLKVWAEDAADLDAATVDAAALGDADAAAVLAAAAGDALVKSEPDSEAAAEDGEEEEEQSEGLAGEEEGEEEEGGSSDGGEGEGAAGRGSRRRQQPQTAAAASGGTGRGLKGELLRLKQAAAEAKAAERRRRQREAIRETTKQQRILRDLGDSRRNSFDDIVLEYSSDEGLGEDTSSQVRPWGVTGTASASVLALEHACGEPSSMSARLKGSELDGRDPMESYSTRVCTDYLSCAFAGWVRRGASWWWQAAA